MEILDVNVAYAQLSSRFCATLIELGGRKCRATWLEG
jgi:hypothetical protein